MPMRAMHYKQILFKSRLLKFCGARKLASIATKQYLLFRPVIFISSDPSKCKRNYKNETERATEYVEEHYKGE